MITDQQYQAALERIDLLERRLNSLSKTIAEMALKSDSRFPVSGHKEEFAGKKDVTRYVYNNTSYCKRDLVLVIVKDYVIRKNVKSSSELFKVFPDSIQGSLGVLKAIKEAEKYANSASRYFFDDEDVIHLDDGTFAVCKEWTCKNIRRFLAVAETLNYKINIINRN